MEQLYLTFTLRRFKILFFSFMGLTVQKKLILISSFILAACSASDSQEKISFSLFCKQLEPISKISSILGADRIDTLCTCGYSETLKSVSSSDMKKAMSTGAGIVDQEVVKVSKASQLAIASCLQNLDVPENAKQLTSSFAEVLRAQAKIFELMNK